MTGRGAAPHHARDERGLTLAELLVYCAVLAILLPLGGVLLHGAVSSQRTVQTVSHASGTVQTATRSVEIGVRSAAAVSLTAPATGTELLVARTRTPAGASGSETWDCQGWFYRDGVLYTRRVPAQDAVTPAITAPSGAGLSQWSILATGVAPRVAGSGVFSATSTGPAVTVGLDLAVPDGTSQLAVVSSSVTTRPQGQTGSAPCF